MFAAFVIMLFTDFYLAIVVLLVGVLMFFLTKFFASRSGRHFIKMQMELGRTNGYIEEMISGQKVVKVFNYEKKNVEEFKKHNEELFTQSVQANRYANILMPAVNQLGNLQYALIALIGGLFVINGVKGLGFSDLLSGHIYSMGLITSFLLYSKSFTQPIGQMAMQLNTVTMALAGASRIFAMTDEPVEIDEGYVELVNAREDENGNPVEVSEHTGKWAWKHPHTDGSQTTYTWLKGKINVNGVDFGYVPNKIVLHDITVYAEPGQKIAFVGPTGAGKTTITNLLNRFYDIADGKIRYDDININKIKKADLRRSLGMVFQDTKLFTGTVMENIRYGKLDASDEEVYKAAKLANADTFIQQLPEGYNTVLKNGGASLSQGQRQLLAIARAAIANPPVLILDEATSSIDSRTEAMVTKGMDAIMEGRTVFVIAHRLSTIKNSDVIMVLDHGHIIERGSHDALLAQKGKYYQLYTGNAIKE
jgi:ATP-binding cassette subfamily B protein